MVMVGAFMRPETRLLENPRWEAFMRFEKALGLLQLARKLAGSAEGLTIDEMAAEASVDRRTAERMRDALWGLFPQMEEFPEGRSKRFRITGGLDGFMQAPTADELAELEAAIRVRSKSSGSERAALLRSLKDKIGSALKGSSKTRIAPDFEALISAEAEVMQAGPRPIAKPEMIALLRDALKSGVVCHFDYPAPGGGAPYERCVRPYGILYGDAHYLVGPEDGKERPMLWRVDRMGEIEFGEAFPGPPKDFDLKAFAENSFGVFQEPAQDVVWRFSPAVAADARLFQFHPRQTIEDQPDGSIIVRFRAGGLLEMTRHLFSWGDAVDILEPPRLREMMVAALETGLKHHGAARPVARREE
jgi:predicted DNA-binding transcriptional regulator YafY